MAKSKGGVNKSAAIRDEIRANPKVTAKEAVENLGKNGIDITEGLFYSVKTSMKQRRKKRRAAARAQANGEKTQSNAAKGGTATAKDTVQVVMKVKGLASELGGIGSLKRVVDALVE